MSGDWIGARIGPDPGYVVERRIGAGYFADVWRVRDLASSAVRAAKIYADRPDKHIAAGHEVAALSRLAHRRIPKLRVSFTWERRDVVVMDLAEGPNLRDEVAVSGVFDAATAARMGLDVLEVLECLAVAGWTYRDLHPKNVHRGQGDGLMVVDFDGARPPGAPAQGGGRVGYRAPELGSYGAVTGACDVFSLAGCLFFALTGDDPPNPSGRMPALRSLVEPDLADLLDACRSSHPNERPARAALRAALTRLRG